MEVEEEQVIEEKVEDKEPKNNNLALNRTFFGQTTALKVQYNKDLNKIFVHTGKKNGESWKWEVAKLYDTELAEVLRLLNKEIDRIGFFHQFESKETKISVNRKEETVFFRIGDISKALNYGEQVVLKLLLENLILRSNFIESK